MKENNLKLKIKQNLEYEEYISTCIKVDKYFIEEIFEFLKTFNMNIIIVIDFKENKHITFDKIDEFLEFDFKNEVIIKITFTEIIDYKSSRIKIIIDKLNVKNYDSFYNIKLYSIFEEEKNSNYFKTKSKKIIENASQNKLYSYVNKALQILNHSMIPIYLIAFIFISFIMMKTNEPPKNLNKKYKQLFIINLITIFIFIMHIISKKILIDYVPTTTFTLSKTEQENDEKRMDILKNIFWFIFGIIMSNIFKIMKYLYNIYN